MSRKWRRVWKRYILCVTLGEGGEMKGREKHDDEDGEWDTNCFVIDK